MVALDLRARSPPEMHHPLSQQVAALLQLPTQAQSACSAMAFVILPQGYAAKRCSHRHSRCGEEQCHR